MNSRLTAYFALTFTSLIWAVGAVLIKYSLNYITPLNFLFWRFLLVSWVFLPVIFFRFKKEKVSLKDLPLLFFLGLLATTLTLGLLFWGMQLTSAVEAIIINALAPIFIIIGGALFLKEKINPLEKIGAAIACLGSFMEVIQPLLTNHKGKINFEGNLLVFLSVIVWVVYSLLARKYQSRKAKFSPFILTATSFITGLITITPLFLYEHFALGLPFFSDDPRGWLGIIFMAIFGSCIAYFTYNLGLSLIEASEASLFIYLQPVFSIPLAIFWLKEEVNQWIIFGSILIIIGIILTEYKPTKGKFRFS